MKQKSKFSTSNITFGILLILTVIILVNANAKSIFLRGLMAVGLYQPDVEAYARHHESFANIPDLTFRSSDGDTTSLSKLKPRTVFVNYWATWCPPCMAEMPAINKLYKQFKDDPTVAFIMVDVDNDLPKAKAFMQKHGYDLPVYSSLTKVPDTLMDGTIPTTMVFGRDGSLVYKHAGIADYGNVHFADFLNLEGK